MCQLPSSHDILNEGVVKPRKENVKGIYCPQSITQTHGRAVNT